MVTFTLFICLIQIQRYVSYTANQDENTEILIFAHIAQLYFEEMCIWQYLARWREDKNYFFLLTEFMPFKFEYNSNFDNILVKKFKFSFSANLTILHVSSVKAFKTVRGRCKDHYKHRQRDTV